MTTVRGRPYFFMMRLRDFSAAALSRTVRKTAKQWVAENFNRIGVGSSFDVNSEVALRLKGSHSSVADLRP